MSVFEGPHCMVRVVDLQQKLMNTCVKSHHALRLLKDTQLRLDCMMWATNVAHELLLQVVYPHHAVRSLKHTHLDVETAQTMATWIYSTPCKASNKRGRQEAAILQRLAACFKQQP